MGRMAPIARRIRPAIRASMKILPSCDDTIDFGKGWRSVSATCWYAAVLGGVATGSGRDT